MKIIREIRDNLSQILAIIEKYLKMKARFKWRIIISFLLPMFSIIMPLIIMDLFFSYNAKFGPWTRENFFIFQMIAYNILLLFKITEEFPTRFVEEKYWKTLPGILIGPFNRINLLLGIFFSHLILIFIPSVCFFIIAYILFPISIFTVLFIVFIYFLIALIFSGIGLILGIFVISRENLYMIIGFGLQILIWFSCVSYPFEIFPKTIQNFVSLNPLYYIFDIFRLAWIEDNIIYTVTTHLFNFIILIICAFSLPILAVFTFNLVYKKYGIVGY